MKTLTIIDTFGFFFRSFYALPPLKSKNGFPTGLLTGFVNFINSTVSEEGSDYIVFALDSEGPSFRAQIDKNYKAQRPEPPEDLKKQLPVAINWIEKMGFKSIKREGYEADDIIASLVKCAKEQDIKVKIVSHDKDLYQLIEDERVVLYDPIKRLEIDEEGAKRKFGVHPKQIRDYLALVGDASDNIPGVRGIGPKGAAKLLNEYGTLENIYENIESIKPPRIKNLLIEGKENAFKSQKLATLKSDVLQSCDFEEFGLPKINPIVKIADELIDLDITAVLRKLKEPVLKRGEPKRVEFKAKMLDTKEKLFDVLKKMENEKLTAFDTETDSLDTKSAKLVGYSFCFGDEEAYYVPVGHSYLGVPSQIAIDDALEGIEKIFQRHTIGHNLKFDLSLLYSQGLPKKENIKDTMILAWLADPQGSVGLDGVAQRYLGHDMIKFKETVKKGENFSNVPLDKATFYAAEDAFVTYKLYFRLLEELRDQKAQHLIKEAEEVEFPFVNTLINMERCGIRIDTSFFEKLKQKTDVELGRLTKKIYDLAGSEFNINSTKQLGFILFEHLKLPPVKKTKTGYSTDEATLERLKELHPLIDYLLKYRELFKLKSTYIDPLLKLAKKDDKNRIYTQFIHTGTATGRLASKNPNLQNIPVKTELGREIRKGFIAEDGYMLVGIDYSQIELRLLAHFSGDEALIEAFKSGRDIHLETAKKLFGDKALEMRNVAKSINFGLIYGMGSKKLGQTLGISAKEAKEIIENYFKNFPTVKEYLQHIQDMARKNGYVETLLGRRRYFDFASASGARLAAFLREATNTVFQGSAADLIKMSMNAIDKNLDYEDERMLLQIHDELIFEVKEQKASLRGEEYKRTMENIYTLKVPLKCSMSVGRSWGDLK